MRKKTIAPLLLTAAFVLLNSGPAFGPSEDDLMKAALQKNSATPALQIFNRWIGSKDPALWELAENYLLAAPDRPNIGFFVLKEDVIGAIIRSNNHSLFPAALAAMRENVNIGSDRLRPSQIQKLYDGIVQAIPQNEFVRSRMIDGKPRSPVLHQNPISQKVGTETIVRYRLPSNPNDFAVAKALFESGAFAKRGIDEVLYEKNGTTKITGAAKITNADQFDYQNITRWILDTHQKQLYPYLMVLRRELTDKTQPTRAELTKRIFTEIETGSPESSEALKLAVRDGMVFDTKDRYHHNGPALRTLHVDLNDDSDLKIARYLLRAGLPTKPLQGLPGKAGTGLDDVQVVMFTRKSEFDFKAEKDNRKSTANHPPEAHIRAVEGELIADRLAEKNFERDPKEGSLWRTEEFLTETNSYYPKQLWPLGCENLKKVSTAEKSETQIAQ